MKKMADVVALVGTAIETLKKLKEIADKIKDAEARNLIADLTNTLADLKLDFAALKEENLRLREDLARKTRHEEQGSQLIPKHGVLYFKEPPSDKPDGPYCPNCKQNGNKLVLMKDNRGTPFERLTNFTCPQCRSNFK